MSKINFKSIFIGLVAGLATTFASAQTSDSIIGKWVGESEDNSELKSEIYLDKDNLYYSKVIEEGGSPKNAGKIVMKKLKYDFHSKTYIGTMSPPDKNIELNITISIVGNDKLKVVAKKFFMTKTIYLIRIK